MCSNCVNHHMPCLREHNKPSSNCSSIDRIRHRQMKKFANGRRSSRPANSSSSSSLVKDYRRSNRERPVFAIDCLPLPALVNIAEQLSFLDASTFRMVSRKFNGVEKIARNSRKSLSYALLSKLFPEVLVKNYRHRSAGGGIGLLQTATPMRMLLSATPSAVLTEVDLSSFSSLGRLHLVNMFKSLDTVGLFGKVCKLNVTNCVLELKDLEWLSSLMPEVWFVALSPQHVVLPNGSNDFGLGDQERGMLMKTMGYCEFSEDCRSTAMFKKSWSDFASSDADKRCLQILALLTRIFPKLEVIQME